MGDSGDEPPDRSENISTFSSLQNQMHSWYGTDDTIGKNWVEYKPKSPLEIIETEIAEKTILRHAKAAQLRWQRQLAPPKGTEFCPIVSSCYKTKEIDVNCFLTKAPGCPRFVSYLDELFEDVEITRENCLQYTNVNP